MLPDDPRHGTYAGIHAHHKAGVPVCDPCRMARRRYQKRLEIDHARGRKRLMPIDPALVAHVERLHAAGMPHKEIARLAGVAPRTVYRVAGYEPAGGITGTSAQKILAVRQQDPGRGYLPALGTIRRLRALVAIGYPSTWLADELGMARGNMSTLIRDARSDRPASRVQVGTARRVAELYDRLHMTPGPSARARRMAEKYRWSVPLAWEDIDDATERPAGGYSRTRSADDYDEAVVLRMLDGDTTVRTTNAEKREICRRWADMGRPLADLERATGWQAWRYFRMRDEEVA